MLLVFLFLFSVVSCGYPAELSRTYPGFFEDIDGDDVIVNTLDGQLRGRSRPAVPNAGSDSYERVNWFIGVPYAQPPVGNLRFRPTQPLKLWTGVKDSLKFSKVCPQNPRGFWFDSFDQQDEDCLYLNIYSPVARKSSVDTDLLAVMVYIHGGSYRVGTGNIFIGDVLAQQGVVVVTINYRLGLLGFLSAGHRDLSGNYGLFDQIQALSWIQKNIRSFQGDPDRVTIFGNSAGGASVGLLSASPAAKGLFQQTIAQSGSALSFWACHNTSVDFNKFFRQVASVVGCSADGSSINKGANGDVISQNRSSSSFDDASRFKNDSSQEATIDDLVECMRILPWHQFHTEEFENAAPKISSEHTDYKPVVDGVVLPKSPRELFSTSARSYAETSFDQCGHVPEGSTFHIKALMTGIIEDELCRHMGGLFLNNGFHEGDNTIDRTYDDGFERGSFEKAIRYVMGDCFGHDDLISDIVLSQYTDWSNCHDPNVNRYKYIEFLTDMSMLTPTVELAGYASDVGVSTYLYILQLIDDNPKWNSNHHEMELSFVFGGPYSNRLVEVGYKANYTDKERLISRRLMTLWTNFAKFGNPDVNAADRQSHFFGNQFTWNTYHKNNPDYLRIQSESVESLKDFKAHRVTLWSKLIPAAAARVSQLKDGEDKDSVRGDMTCLVGVIAAVAVFISVFIILVIIIIALIARDKRRSLR